MSIICSSAPACQSLAKLMMLSWSGQCNSVMLSALLLHTATQALAQAQVDKLKQDWAVKRSAWMDLVA
jgi:hypothetical protein